MGSLTLLFILYHMFLWVQIENITTEELITQISKCPSKALVNISYSACTQFSAHVNTKSGSIR
ncbi:MULTISPECIES: hypothetical protein [Bacteroides]|uniref:hypothetical protein n=1 Tax=Bacteroides sp. TaxID=29523 RepID=UPI0032C14174